MRQVVQRYHQQWKDTGSLGGPGPHGTNLFMHIRPERQMLLTLRLQVPMSSAGSLYSCHFEGLYLTPSVIRIADWATSLLVAQ